MLRIQWDLVTGVFPPAERRRFWVVLVAAIAAALFETVGVASITPFMGLVLDETLADRTPALRQLLATFGAETPGERLLVMGLLTLAAIVLGNAISALSQYLQQRFVARTRRRVSRELFAGYMSSPYRFHVRRDAPSVLKVLYDDLGNAIGALQGMLTYVSRLLVLAAIIALLLYQNPRIALFSMVLLGGSYALAYRFSRSRQRRLGEEMSEAYGQRNRAAQEGLGGIKELTVLGRTSDSVKRFDEASAFIADAQAETMTVGSLPRYFLESVAYGGLVLVTLAMVRSGGGTRVAIPTIALFAFAAYRLMPALQQLYQSSVSMRFAHGAVNAFFADWAEVCQPQHGSVANGLEAAVRDKDDAGTSFPAVRAAPGRPPEIGLANVTMAYDGSAHVALRDVSLTVRPGESLGIVGRTGSGKTTLVDVLMGLYQPRQGEVVVDGQSMSREGAAALQREIGYVPQHVFLANASIAANIAFGVAERDIDLAAVHHASQLAQADEFIGRLPRQYEAIIGERGVRLSGGQRQRLGIARALYHQPSILVFDEATSALDGLTEAALMRAIRQLAGERTVILIAHRLRTVEACDRIVMLDEGEIIGDGTWRELLEKCSRFADLVRGPSVGAVA
ncbi:MAG: ABC transporter ATP-binding protein [Acidobacteria bacterium]|nr:ABC transporter ATP-binding protein [Acidobacteriota bacterium]